SRSTPTASSTAPRSTSAPSRSTSGSRRSPRRRDRCPDMSLVSSMRLLLLVSIAMGLASAGCRTTEQEGLQPTNEAPNGDRTLANYFTLPADRTWGSTSAVEIDPDGRSIWVAERCGANTCAGSPLNALLKFDASGALVESFAAGVFVWPHGIHIDTDGNIW